MTQIKVAFLGNMNNNHFSMARFLRDRGVDAEVLLYDQEFDHFQPSADTFDLDYMNFTRRLSWGSVRQFLRATASDVREDLAPYGILIGCGFAPAYCEKAGRQLDIFAPYGADMMSDASLRLVSPHLITHVWTAALYQARGIAKARVIHMALTNEILEARYEQLKGASQRWVEGLPMVHTPTYRPDVIAGLANRTHWGNEFERLRRDADLMVVYHGRHCWTCPRHDLNNKGTDKFLNGWALFVRRNPRVKARLVTVEYGKDVAASRALIRDLGIESSVAWLPQMFRKDLMVGLNLADIVCGEFEHNWMAGGVLYEALALGKPLLAWRDDDPYSATYPSLYPILRAGDPESVAARLEQYWADPESCRQMGEEGRRWYQREIVERSLDRYMTYVHERAAAVGAA